MKQASGQFIGKENDQQPFPAYQTLANPYLEDHGLFETSFNPLFVGHQGVPGLRLHSTFAATQNTTAYGLHKFLEQTGYESSAMSQHGQSDQLSQRPGGQYGE
jgi:hypothetical protein